VGCPIRTPADHSLFATPRSFSQLITSFFASESLGIPHTLLFYFFSIIGNMDLSMPHVDDTLPCSPLYSSSTLFQYVNELFARFTSPRLYQNGSSDSRPGHPATLFSSVGSRQLTIGKMPTHCPQPSPKPKLSSLNILKVNSFVYLTSYLLPLTSSRLLTLSGEYRIRTDDPLLAKQVL
jgi:hypothetical protein